MEEKEEKTGCGLIAAVFIIPFSILLIFVYYLYSEITAERYEKKVTGIVMEIKQGEVINISGYAISEVIGIAMAEQASVIVKTSEEIIEVKTETELTNDAIGKKAIIKEKGKIYNGKEIREELFLISVE